jgi:hypothetical protein
VRLASTCRPQAGWTEARTLGETLPSDHDRTFARPKGICVYSRMVTIGKSVKAQAKLAMEVLRTILDRGRFTSLGEKIVPVSLWADEVVE